MQGNETCCPIPASFELAWEERNRSGAMLSRMISKEETVHDRRESMRDLQGGHAFVVIPPVARFCKSAATGWHSQPANNLPTGHQAQGCEYKSNERDTLRIRASSRLGLVEFFENLVCRLLRV